MSEERTGVHCTQCGEWIDTMEMLDHETVHAQAEFTSAMEKARRALCEAADIARRWNLEEEKWMSGTIKIVNGIMS